MFGKQGKHAPAPTSTARIGQKPGGKGIGLGNVKKALEVKGIKGNNNKIK